MNNFQTSQTQQQTQPQVSDEMKQEYEKIFNTRGVEAANNWLKQQIMGSHMNVQADNAAVIKEIQEKYAEITAIPAVQAAIQDYINMDLNPSISLREQNFHNVVNHIAGIYQAGYDAAMSLRSQNDSAKARMASAVNSAMPNYQSNRVFTREDIKAMSPEEFLRNEKTIFDQLSKGLIK